LKSGLLDGKEAIRDFIGTPSDYMLRKWVKAGMPVRLEDGRWLAHKENLDDFFKKYTRVDSRNADFLDSNAHQKKLVKQNNP